MTDAAIKEELTALVNALIETASEREQPAEPMAEPVALEEPQYREERSPYWWNNY
jgi:hypothetical protein